MQVWPALTIRNGKCVRLKQGDYHRETVYGNSPADMATRWVSDGAPGLHVVDLDGARDGKSHNFDAIAEIAQQVDVPIQVGGGIRTTKAFEQFHDIGINRWVIGTQALANGRMRPGFVSASANRRPKSMAASRGTRESAFSFANRAIRNNTGVATDQSGLLRSRQRRAA